MQLVDRIEKRRFVGREFLLFLWLESELFDATLRTAEHGSFGLWLERSLILSEGKESTRITAPMPGEGREAKEALLRGQLPESAGVRIAWRDEETSLVLKAESLGFSGLKLKTVLDKAEAGGADLVDELAGRGRGRPASQAVDQHEVFYERMGMTQEFEQLMEALFRDFLAVRLSARWQEAVVPAASRWASGLPVDLEAYLAKRNAPEATDTATPTADPGMEATDTAAPTADAGMEATDTANPAADPGVEEATPASDPTKPASAPLQMAEDDDPEKTVTYADHAARYAPPPPAGP